MRNNVFKIVLFIALCISILGILFISLNRDMSRSIAENPYLAEDYYTVKEYQGKVAIFNSKSNLPLNIFDTYVSTLPQHDRMLLEEG
ncbi:MAG: hypothetical protein IKU15_08760, partial [Clostridia bacterium]|nr:hypothetical protein [Clostridia bacterium]